MSPRHAAAFFVGAIPLSGELTGLGDAPSDDRRGAGFGVYWGGREDKFKSCEYVSRAMVGRRIGRPG
jgi:hypothetical protein